MSFIISSSSAQTAKDETSKILDEIVILSSPSKIAARKTELLRRLNFVQPPIGRLPTEILSTIFKMLAPPPVTFDDSWLYSYHSRYEVYSPLLLGAVSTFWRTVATSTPSLWTSFRWDLRWKDNVPPTLLLIFLKNSANSLIHLKFFFTDAGPRDALVDPSVDRELVANLPRIQTLKLSYPSANWDKHMDKLPSVVNLVLDHDDFLFGRAKALKACGDLILGKCRNLRRLSLRKTDHAAKLCYRFPWSLTVLHLHSLPVDTAVQILCSCSNIVELWLGLVEDAHKDLDETSRRSWFGQPVVFTRLELFRWNEPNSDTVWDWIDAFMDTAQMPVLRTLELIDEEPTRNLFEGNAIIQDAFFGRLTKTIINLCLDGVDDVYSEGNARLGYPTLFSPDSSIEHISITSFSIDALHSIIGRLYRDSHAGTQTQIEMPKLRSLAFSRLYRSDDLPNFDIISIGLNELEPQQCDSLVGILEQRLAGRSSFRLEFTELYPGWTYGTKERLRSLVRQGTKVEIIEDGRLVDWLEDVGQGVWIHMNFIIDGLPAQSISIAWVHS